VKPEELIHIVLVGRIMHLQYVSHMSTHFTIIGHFDIQTQFS